MRGSFVSRPVGPRLGASQGAAEPTLDWYQKQRQSGRCEGED